MIKRLTVFAGIIIGLANGVVLAETPKTIRLPQFQNSKVTVWETIIYPAKNQQLKMHRHDNDRVLVALTDGFLKVTDDKGQSHTLRLEKDKAYYLPRDEAKILHTDENMTTHPIKVMVIELNEGA